MRRGLSASLPLVLLAACASSPPETAATDPAVATFAANGAETVDIAELDTGLVCERSTPTGSRISEQTCYTREQYTARQAQLQEMAQRDVNDMRDLQRARDQAEQSARDQAAQRAVSGGF